MIPVPGNDNNKQECRQKDQQRVDQQDCQQQNETIGHKKKSIQSPDQTGFV
jgi:hypothetical protein